MIKPVLRYPGAKWVLSKWICSNLPPHDVYLEPFFGSGAVFFGKEPARTETINDIDGNVVNLFRVIRERPHELFEAVALTPWARDEHTLSHNEAADDLERARLFLVRCWQTFGSQLRGASGWRNRTTGKSPKEYADPPYIPDTRGKYIYTYECDDDYHIRLLDVLENHRGAVVISGYESPLYNERLSHWRRIEKVDCQPQIEQKRLGHRKNMECFKILKPGACGKYETNQLPPYGGTKCP